MKTKRILCMAVGLTLAAGLCIAQPQAAQAAETTETCFTYSGKNVDYQNYHTWKNWADNVTSYLTVTEDGQLMRFQAGAADDEYAAAYYNSDLELQKTVAIDEELPLFGAFYADDNGYYVLSGQSNTDESDEVEVYRLTKYDKDWNRIGAASLYGANTYIPFDAGSARIDSDGDLLFIRTCHEMYQTSDGYHHQANVTIEVNTDTMTVVDYFTGIMNISYGYVSHSFNQFIKLDNGHIVGVDHGDAHLRSVVLTKYTSAYSASGFTKSCSYKNLLSISGTSGDNATGVQVGGFEVTSDSYVVVGKAVEMGDDYSASGAQCIFVATEDRSMSGDPVYTEITEYGTSWSNPQLTKISDDQLLLLWDDGETIYYCTLDSQGQKTSEIYTMTGNLSDCQPVVYNGKVIWYVYTGDAITFYQISASDFSQHEMAERVTGHDYTVTNATASNATASRVCKVCGYSDSFTTPTSILVYGCLKNADGSNAVSSYYTTAFSTSVTEGQYMEMYYSFGGSPENSEYTVTSSDPSVVKVADSGAALKFVGAGKATVTFAAKYRPSVSKTVTFTVSHVLGDGEVIQTADCIHALQTQYVCAVCGQTTITTGSKDSTNHVGGTYVSGKKTASCGTDGYTGDTYCSSCNTVLTKGTVISATGNHTKVTVPAVAATCTESGMTEGVSCSVCGQIFSTRTEIPALGHDYQLISSVQDDCEQPGTNTYQCSRCGDSYTEAIPAKSHQWGEPQVKAASCTAEGLKTYTCSVCGKIRTETIAALGHTYTSVVTAPTCTEQGYTTYTCSRCGSSYQDSYTSALGHTWQVVSTDRTDCTVDGTVTYQCTVCNSSKTEVIPAGQHTWNEEITTEPGCTTEGVKTYTCSVCGTAKTESIPAKGHVTADSVIENRVEADALHEGSYEEVYYCTVCKTEVSRRTVVIPKLTSVALSETTITLDTDSFLYDGQAHRPTVTVTYNGTVLAEGTHYEVLFSDNVIPGTATVTITGKAPFTGIVTKSFTIAKQYQITRLSGDNRYATAIESAEALKKTMNVDQFDAVVVASGVNFPDALAGSPLAVQENAPILLVGSNDANQAQAAGTALTIEYIKENLVAGGSVYVLGGESAVSKTTYRTFIKEGYRVHRLSGDSRYDTNLAIVNAMNIPTGTDVVIVRGYTSYKNQTDAKKKSNPQGYADSLSVSGVAGAKGMPIFLAAKDGLTPEQIAKIEEINPQHIYVIGGTGAVSEDVYSQIMGIAGGTVKRIAGDNRYETSVAIAEEFGLSTSDSAVVAYGQNFPDGLTGGVLAAKLGAPLLLTETGKTEVQHTFLTEGNAYKIYVLGGTAVLPDETINSLIQ